MSGTLRKEKETQNHDRAQSIWETAVVVWISVGDTGVAGAVPGDLTDNITELELILAVPLLKFLSMRVMRLYLQHR